MNRRSLFHHAVGIGSLCLTVALLYTAYSGVPALRYLRGRSGWRTR